MNVDEAKSMIRATGLRATGARVGVLQLIASSSRALSHSEVVEKLSSYGWDASTLYRNLQDLTDANVFRRTDLGDRVWRYEIRGSEGGHSTRHPHFICVECGDVTCLPPMTFDGSKSQVPSGALRDDTEIQVRGVCDPCREP